MLRFNNLNISKFSLVILSSILLSGCGNKSQDDNSLRNYNENGVKAYVFDNGSKSFLTVQELNGINAKTYRDLMELVKGDVDVLKLISPDEFNLDFLDDLEVDHLDLVTPEEGFDYKGISALNGLDSISISIGSDTDLDGFIKYIKSIDLKNIDLEIRINDSSISLQFANILKKYYFKANSITLTVSDPKCLNFLYNLNADSVKVSLLISDDYDAAFDFQVNKNVNNFILELAAAQGNVTINLNKLKIKSLNNDVSVQIEKTSRINLIIPEDAILVVPNGTTIDTEKENILDLKTQDN